VCKKIIFFLALFYSSLRLGCSSATIVKRYYTNPKYSQGYGIVLCSISRLNIKPYYSGYDLDFLSLDNHKKYHFYIDPPPKYSTIKPDYRNDSAEGYYRAIILPVGKYKIFNFQLDNTYGGSGWVFKCKNEFEIPFQVYENKVTYVGDYLCVPFKAKILLVKQPAGGIFVVSSRLAADSMMIRNKFKELDFNTLVNETPVKTINTESNCIVIN
jgi:hypothetical protein